MFYLGGVVCNKLHLHVDVAVAGETEPLGEWVVLGTLLASVYDVVQRDGG